MTVNVVVMAKAPVPGKVKTRLTPPYTPSEAAALAAAALVDTLDAIIRTPAAKPVLALDGPAGSWLPPGVAVIGQRGEGLDERLANAMTDQAARHDPAEDGARGAGHQRPVLLIGMDTPQVTPALLAMAHAALSDDAAAVFGPAADGGFWLLGLRRPAPELVAGIPMSRADTGARQRERLIQVGLRVTDLPVLTDVDTAEDAQAVAWEAPTSRFAAALHALDGRVIV